MVPIPDSSDVLVIIEYRDFRGAWPNLFRVVPEGDVAWESVPPGLPDAYLSAAVHGDEVCASTHNGWLVCLDLATGRVRKRVWPAKLPERSEER